MKVSSKFLGYFKRNRAAGRSLLTALASMLLTVLLFFALCFVLHIAPFGDRTFLYEDMKQQYVDFFSYYHNVWHGKDGFIFSYNCGLGSEMFGIWAYYLMSPFLLMFALIPAIHYATAVTFLIMMKMAAMSFCMSLLFSHISKKYYNLNMILSVAYAYCGWTVANMTNIMWLDAVILMPIVVIGFDRLMRRKKYGWPLYVISVMAMVVVNYYIAAMVLMFLGVFAVLELLFLGGFGKQSSLEAAADNSANIIRMNRVGIRDFLRFMAASFTALLLDLWFLVPTVMSLMGSNKDHSEVMTEAFEKYLPSSEAVARNLNPISILPKLFTMSYDSMEIMEGLPNIYFGAALIVPCVLFFVNRKIDAKIRALFGTFLAIVTAFFCVKPLNTLAHGGTEAYGYLYRYSFVFSFVCLIMVFLCLKSDDGVGARKVMIAEILTIAMFAVVAFSRVRFIGGKALFINLMLIVISGCAVLSRLVSKEKSKYYALPILGVILLADLSLNFICIYRSSSMNAETVSSYKAKCAETEMALTKVKELDEGDENYRIESLNPRTPNDSIHYDYRGTTSYNSLLKVENRLLMYKLGFNDNGLYTMYEEGNTKCVDAILGIRYLIKGSDEVTRNVAALPADCVNEDSVPELLELIEPADNPFDAQEAVLRYFTGEGESVFAKDEVVAYREENTADGNEESIVETKADNDGGTYIYKVTPVEDGEVYFYMNRDNTKERSLEIWCDGEFVSGYGNASCQKVIDLGYHNKGDEISLEIKDADGLGSLPDEPVLVTEMIEALTNAVNKP